MNINNYPNKLSFDTSSISQSGFSNPSTLGRGVTEQQQFVSIRLCAEYMFTSFKSI